MSAFTGCASAATTAAASPNPPPPPTPAPSAPNGIRRSHHPLAGRTPICYSALPAPRTCTLEMTTPQTRAPATPSLPPPPPHRAAPNNPSTTAALAPIEAAIAAAGGHLGCCCFQPIPNSKLGGRQSQVGVGYGFKSWGRVWIGTPPGQKS
eukprot:CAMPEP_0184715522 /NCGR_PEP_ID=MMETSP0314-20130426/5439_1 /TAXON_ID=38298 /ORGANISM="Rhodella maculata, Strain CCMP 736" /LENGTH=150 /DNA_ID=CAMNT_0027178693 /DNA_START=83 /DNA_END=535 /DNA_ORIENTATION=-